MISCVAPFSPAIATWPVIGAPAAALDAGEPVTVPLDRSTFIDGIGSTRVLDEMWPLLRDIVDDSLIVSTVAAKNAVRTLVTANAVIAEGAGAVAVAAAMAEMVGQGGMASGGCIVCVVSGGNIDMADLRGILAQE